MLYSECRNLPLQDHGIEQKGIGWQPWVARDPMRAIGVYRTSMDGRPQHAVAAYWICFEIEQIAEGTMGQAAKIEFLFWEDCPSHPEAWKRLHEVMAELDIEAPVEKIEVLTDEDADRLSFPGSPTIRVDGKDIDPAGAAQMGTALTCRVYVLQDGRYSPVPSREMIRQALVRDSE